MATLGIAQFWGFTSYLSHWENFKLCGLPYLVLMEKFELVIPWCLENRARHERRFCSGLVSVVVFSLGHACFLVANKLKQWLG